MTGPDDVHAALAWVAAQAVSSAVLFNVEHDYAKAPAEPAAAGTSPPAAPGRLATETMTFRAAGAGFRLYTWASDTPVPPAGGVSAEEEGFSYDGAECFRYGGSVLINPGRAHDATRSTEVLVSLSHDPWSTGYVDSLMLATACRELTRAAARHDVPILFLQSPVAPFRSTSRAGRADGSGEAPRVANALALRMVLGGVANAPRLDTVIELTEIARSYGFGLHVTDRRLGRIRGHWWTVLGAEPRTYEERKRELFGWAPPEPLRSVLLCTVLGPGRPGSTAAITADLTARNVGIAAVSALSMHGITFVNLMVPVAPVRHLASAPAAAVLPIAEGLGLVGSDCGLTTRRDAVPGRSRIAAGPAADYTLLISGPFASSPAAPAAAADHPLWTYWSIPADALPAGDRPPGPTDLLLHQLTADPVLVTGARVDYQRTRTTPDRRVVARAKITVSLSPLIEPADLPTRLTELCDRARRETVTTLVQQGVPLRGIELALDWRERWVGHIG